MQEMRHQVDEAEGRQEVTRIILRSLLHFTVVFAAMVWLYQQVPRR